jgi:DNA-binding transcriptional LysR family regulator
MSALRAFEATVRLGSVSAAAEALRLTPGAVSRAVQDFEAHLGISLFERGQRSLRPSASANLLAEDIRALFARLEEALARAKGSTQQDPLVISCEPSLLIRWLIPRLSSLQDWLGVHDIRFVSAGGPVPFAREGIALAIRRLDFALPKGAIAEPFLQEQIGPVCRPEIAVRIGSSGALRDATLLHTRTRNGAWADWATHTQTQLHACRDLTFEHFYLSLQAAIAGLGLAIGPRALVADDLAAGTLIAPRGFVPDGTDYVLMSDGNASAKVFGAMLDWLKAETQALL